MKQCFKCAETKPLSDFYRHPAMGDGHLNKCKSCACKDVRENRRTSTRAIEYDRERSRLPHRVAARAEYISQYVEKHRDKYVARYTLTNAVRDGRVKKLPCEFCGDAKVHGHHHDYSKPLDVTWLCCRCHRRLHALEDRKKA